MLKAVLTARAVAAAAQNGLGGRVEFWGLTRSCSVLLLQLIEPEKGTKMNQ